MATATPPHPNSSRFSRIGFSLGLRSQPELRGRAQDSKRGYGEEDWYIPYTGPYEPPPEPRSSRNKDRDSWGDPIFGLSNEEPTRGNDSHVHYDSGFGSSEESRAQVRGRSLSMVSYYTGSTGVEHPRQSFAAARRSNVSASHKTPVSTYTSLDPAGGVGESPIPHHHGQGDRPTSHRTSFASLFGTFGIKSPSNSNFPERGIRSPSGRWSTRPSTTSGIDRSGNKLPTSDHRRTASGDSHNHSIRDRRGIKEPLQSLNSQTTDEDYYNSYYSTLVQTPAKAQPSPSGPSDSTGSAATRQDPLPQHPYARVFPRTEDLPPQPQTAPPTSDSQQFPAAIPRLTVSNSQNPSAQHLPNRNGSAPAPHFSPESGRQQEIKESISVPNFKVTTSAKPTFATSQNSPKRKDWWLSAETWCDALFFPRPRLRLKNEGGSSGRIVSPPGSPVLRSELGKTEHDGSVASRVLAHSRSLVDLRGAAGQLESKQNQSEAGMSSVSPPSEGTEKGAASAILKPHRPKSWALDDLALLTPVPSLAKVLEDGERLAGERQKWQNEALNSLGNKHARSVSRARSKSLTAKGRKTSTKPQSNFDYLAARAHLGNQDIIPVVSSTGKLRKSSRQETNSQPSQSLPSNSQSQTQTNSSSLTQTMSRSSKSHSRSHSRNDSWSKTAIKIAKSTAAACFNSDLNYMPVDERFTQRPSRLEDALQRTDTKVIRLADPALIPVERNLSVSTRNGVSPTPSGVSSGVSDARIGIALSTPPTEFPSDQDTIRLATHPYAQGGLYSYTGAAAVQEKPAEYAGPHPSATAAVTLPAAVELPEGPAARHKLPPHVTLNHPYAQNQSRDSYDERIIKHPRPDSDIPPPAKMWAPFAPGAVREILPTDLRYSPFIEGDGKMEAQISSRTSGITDTVGVGEALAYAVEHHSRESRDSGLGTSENIHGSRRSGDFLDEDAMDLTIRLDSPSRMPVQYDASRPTYLLRGAQKSVETAHTLASSPLEHLTPKIPDYVREGATVSPFSSGSSSRRNSPRPLGSPHDLGGFQDLFYKPGASPTSNLYGKGLFGEHNSNDSQTRLINVPLDLRSPHRRPASGLTSLARKLSEEYEQLSIIERTNSQYSQSSGSGIGQFKSPTGKLTEGSLEFVFEEMPHPDSPTQGRFSTEPGDEVILPFQPEGNIPEDVASASETENEKQDDDEDITEVFQLKQVETSTPAAISNDHRLSFTGQMVYTTDRPETKTPRSITTDSTTKTDVGAEMEIKSDPTSPLQSPTTEARILSGLQAPLTDLTRSSYITTSTMSRMSGLSDFPAPPKDLVASGRMSLLSAYFNEALGRSSGEALAEAPQSQQPSVSTKEGTAVPSPSQNFNSDNRVTFGAGADAEEIVQALSNQPSHI